MQHLHILLPALLVLVGFFYRVFVDKRFTITDFIERMIEMPVEIVFLAGGFLIAFTLQDPANHLFGILSLFVGFFISGLVFFLCKRSQEAFLKDERWGCVCYSAGSLFPSIFSFIFCVGLLLP